MSINFAYGRTPDGIAENYVSETAIINKAFEKGFCFKGVKELAQVARNGNRQLLDVFFETGEELGELVQDKIKEDGFENLVTSCRPEDLPFFMKEFINLINS